MHVLTYCWTETSHFPIQFFFFYENTPYYSQALRKESWQCQFADSIVFQAVQHSGRRDFHCWRVTRREFPSRRRMCLQMVFLFSPAALSIFLLSRLSSRARSFVPPRDNRAAKLYQHQSSRHFCCPTDSLAAEFADRLPSRYCRSFGE